LVEVKPNHFMKFVLYIIGGLLISSCSQSDLAAKLESDYAYKSNWDVNTINALWVDSAYGSSERLNSYQPGEKRVNYYFRSIDITFEVSGEGAVNPDFIVGVWDGKHF